MEISDLEAELMHSMSKFFLLRSDKIYKWASLINSLACIILEKDTPDGKIDWHARRPTSNDLDLANDAIKEVTPYLGAE